MNFWETLWRIVVAFFFVAYLILLFQIMGDLLRDRNLNGGVKALWLICFFVAPVVSGLVYVLFRGKGMASRQNLRAQAAVEETENYIRSLDGKESPSQQIQTAKALHAAGDISDAEFDRLKALALA
ncbi:SHOCT domain-containing protein [Pseudarthrobacter sp. PS3-L1]|uniref:SHOCT domain-containing protein n=1 Tax=Pseudarthrobacter sp. PS3-L1 TaxID=3046207 RepID=UPI0024BBE2C4|nr:SHOCT domain-containing protein [Pseudarthrobacter sp. PS3-L1]MDJ0319125.1 SHOCT domain-containing protein [Pseudarthrobacter sp. PS3-L1]